MNRLSAAMVNQMCVMTPGPSELKTSLVAPGCDGPRVAVAASAVITGLF